MFYFNKSNCFNKSINFYYGLNVEDTIIFFKFFFKNLDSERREKEVKMIKTHDDQKMNDYYELMKIEFEEKDVRLEY